MKGAGVRAERLLEEDATAQLAALASGGATAAALMAATLDRIEAVNPGLNAVVALRPRAELMAEAEAADRMPRRGVLHGLPMAVKDLVAVRGVPSTMGSPLFAGQVPAADEPLAARLRAAGAILIGKTNVPEFGLGSHTFNPVHGATRNPYDPARSAGGSSGGAAAALAARLVALADGSDMMGSLRNPAAWCNVYGMRPSYGLVPRTPGGEAFIATLSTDGPMARSPRDLALLLSVLAQPEPRVPFGRTAGDVLTAPAAPLGRPRVGWLGDWGGDYPMEAGVLETCRGALDGLIDIGCVVEEVAPPFEAEALWESWVTLRSFAIAGRLGPLWEEAETRGRLKPEAAWEIERGLALSGREIQAASAIRSAWYARAAELFARYDALVLPSAQVWPFPVAWRWPERIGYRPMDTYHRWMEVVVPVSLAGLPAVAMPAGFGAGGLPMGVQAFGPAGADAALLRLAGAYHRATGWPQARPAPG